MMNINNKKMISYKILSVFRKISEIDKKTRKYGTDELLYDSEVHIIKAIKENEGIHITGLADFLNITKGAVSQTIIKLQKKGMVIKQPDVANQSRMLLKLTKKGELAYLNHEKLHRDFENVIECVLNNESQENQEFLQNFLDSLDNELVNFKE